MRKTLCLALTALLLLGYCASARAAGEAALYNGDFSVRSGQEALPAGWQYDAWIADASDAYTELDESGAVAVVVENFEENDARICQRIEVSPNTVYRFSCDIFAEGVWGDAGASLSVLDTFAASEQLYDTQSYTSVELIGRTGPSQTELTLALRVGGYGALAVGTARFRNVAMEQLEAAPAGATSFETIAYDGGSSAPSEEVDAPNWPVIVLMTLLCALALGLCYQKTALQAALPGEGEGKDTIRFLLLCALAFRFALSLLFVGHSTDIGCFLGWSGAMVQYGPAGFYTSGMFADYPPGYMYALWLMGGISKLFGLPYGHPVHIMLVKLPAMLADIACAYLAYRIARKLGASEGKARLLLGVVAFNPLFAFISGGWGQIDSILTLLLLFTMLLFVSGRPVWAGALYGLAILIKPQALMAGPLFAAAYFLEFKIENWKKKLAQTSLAVLCAAAVILLPSLPFSKGQPANWLLEKYFSTATSYEYASIEAFNLFALFNGNWAPIGGRFLFLTYGTWGYIFLLLSVAFSVFLYYKGRRDGQRGILPLAFALLLTALFTLGPYMHERYVVPALAALLAAALLYDDRRLFQLFFGYSASVLFNVLCAFYIVDFPYARGGAYDVFTILGSLANLLLFEYLLYVAVGIVLLHKTVPSVFFGRAEAPPPPAPQPAPVQIAREPFARKLSLTRRDRLYCWGLTLLYAAVSLVNLGSFTAPETEYVSASPGQSAVLTFDGAQDVAKAWVFGGIAEGKLQIVSDNGQEAAYEQKNDDMFRWHEVELGLTAQRLTLTTYSGKLAIREIAFFDSEGNRVAPQAADDAAAPMVDEQSTIPAYPTYYNGMYFDELYHARTAYEHLHGIDPYENSHPPLGKVFIMLGVAVFGMNPFGWRIAGALFGVAMVPLFYLLCRRMFKKPEYALLGALLFAFDFMHFTQTRIATIDVFAVFFILLMYYYMYQYSSMNFYTDGLKATLRPLGLAGIFFGLGAATKWICIYAGGGLAVLLFLSLFHRYREYRAAQTDEELKHTESFWRETLCTLLFCVGFFVLIPVGIYLLSYAPYYLCEKHYGLKDVWNYQKFMWNYHSGLTATHPYQSSWWQWPLTLKPMWYCWGGGLLPGGNISTLTASGNPAVWWVCSVCTVTLAVRRVLGKVKGSPALTVIFVGLCANFLPWVLVTRCTFIYHFFASVPFVILAGVYLLREWEERDPRAAWAKWAWIGACLLLFALLYPGLSGLPIPLAYAKFLQDIPGGNLIYMTGI